MAGYVKDRSKTSAGDRLSLMSAVGLFRGREAIGGEDLGCIGRFPVG